MNGGSNQKYNLRWHDYPQSVVTSFRHLKEDEDFVDVTLACNSQQFTAHKVVLSACSPYFKKLLKVRLLDSFSFLSLLDYFLMSQKCFKDKITSFKPIVVILLYLIMIFISSSCHFFDSFYNFGIFKNFKHNFKMLKQDPSLRPGQKMNPTFTWAPKLVSQKSEIIVSLGAGSHNGLSQRSFNCTS